MPIPSPLLLTDQNLAFDQPSETVSPRLTDHARTMKQDIYQVAEDFYVAVGYGNANMTMVVGTDGVLLVDSLENEEAAREALTDLRRFSDKPIKALIYPQPFRPQLRLTRAPRSVPSRERARRDLRARAVGDRDAGQSESRDHVPLTPGLLVRFRP